MALRFNGSSDYIDIGDQIIHNRITALTIVARVKFDNLTNAYSAVVSRVGGGCYFQLFVKSSGQLAVYLTAIGGSVAYDGTGSHTLATGAWYQIAFTYDATSGLVGYVDGATDASVGASGPLSLADADLTIGTDTNTPGRFVAGDIAHVAIYNAALSAADIALLASGISPIAVRGESLVNYWPLLGSQGAADLGPAGILGTLFGTSPDNEPPYLIPYGKKVFSGGTAEGEWPALFTASTDVLAAQGWM
jgi:hypothetical protein